MHKGINSHIENAKAGSKTEVDLKASQSANTLRIDFSVNKRLSDANYLTLFTFEDESHLLLRSHLTMEDLESEDFKVHDPCAAWLNGKIPD